MYLIIYQAALAVVFLGLAAWTAWETWNIHADQVNDDPSVWLAWCLAIALAAIGIMAGVTAWHLAGGCK